MSPRLNVPPSVFDGSMAAVDIVDDRWCNILGLIRLFFHPDYVVLLLLFAEILVGGLSCSLG